MFTNFIQTPSPSSQLKDTDKLMTTPIWERNKSRRYKNSFEDMLHTHLRHKQKRMSLSERIERNKRHKHQLSQLNQNEINIIRKYTDSQILKYLELNFC